MEELIVRVVSFVILQQATAFIFRSYRKRITELNKRVANLEKQNRLIRKCFEKMIEVLEKE